MRQPKADTGAVRRLAWKMLEEDGRDPHMPWHVQRQQTREQRHQRRRAIALAMKEAERRILAADEEKRREAAEAKRQHVYVLGSAGQPIKIGIAKDVDARRRELQVGFPWPLRVYFYIEAFGDLARRVERECHLRIADYQTNGEWFDYDPYDAAELVKEVLAKLSPSPQS